jgi:putative two-component system response regulator
MATSRHPGSVTAISKVKMRRKVDRRNLEKMTTRRYFDGVSSAPSMKPSLLMYEGPVAAKRVSAARGHVLVVDDMAPNLRLLEALLEAEGYVVQSACDGNAALALIAENPPDVVLSDIRMPECDGFEVCARVKSNPNTRLIPVVLMTASHEERDRVRALDAGADDLLAKPLDQSELKARIRSLMRLKQFTDDLESAETVLRSLAQMIELRDAETSGHCERLARYATTLGEWLGLGGDDLEALRLGGYFHDIGKIGIPDAILLKPGKLTADEYEQMKLHTVIGDRLCGDMRALRPVRPIVRSHHERLDGSGYPDGLCGDAVPLLAQIIGIVDVYDAITTSRPYKPALTSTFACAELRKEAARGWRDPELVETFIMTLSESTILRPLS